jgi:hypothetical protein
MKASAVPTPLKNESQGVSPGSYYFSTFKICDLTFVNFVSFVVKNSASQRLCGEIALHQLRHIIEDHHHREDHQEHERGLVDPLFQPLVNVSSDRPFDRQEQDHSAIQDRDRQ